MVPFAKGCCGCKQPTVDHRLCTVSVAEYWLPLLPAQPSVLISSCWRELGLGPPAEGQAEVYIFDLEFLQVALGVEKLSFLSVIIKIFSCFSFIGELSIGG